MLVLDGSMGEGGGQILRSALALSLVTGQPFVLERIRANRERPGLQRQHLTAVFAAAEIGSARVEGAELGSMRLAFRPQGIRSGSFRFEPRMHDNGEKVVLGVKIPRGGGKRDGEIVLDLLAKHPSTARFIATKLARRFVSDEPLASLVDRAAARFQQSDGDIREVVRTIITSKEFFDASAYRAKVKTPFEFVASAVRASGVEPNNPQAMIQALRQLGAGYRATVLVDADGVPRAYAGWRVLEFLASGRHVYVDDLVTDAAARSQGLGAALLDWLKAEARRLGCTRLQLDSGTQRKDAHAFYLREGLRIEGFHFGIALD